MRQRRELVSAVKSSNILESAYAAVRRGDVKVAA